MATIPEVQGRPKSFRPLWKYLILAGVTLVIVAGLAVGLGVGLTRNRGAGSGSDGRSNATKLTVYWGAQDDTTTLDDVCSDSSYDIVNLAFLTHFFADGGYPRLRISTLNGPSAAQKNAGATALQDGTSLVSAITACKSNGKLVLLSMGGANDYSDVKLNNDAQGQQIADTVWNLFLGGTNNPELRPFGSLKLDGVDFDNESGQSIGYLAMAERFRSNFRSDASKKYFLAAAPQCPFPDSSESLNVCQQLDYVWVQFYNNGNCNIAQPGFDDAVAHWSTGIGNAKLFIGALASGADSDQGYVSAAALNIAVDGVISMDLPNFGGVMLWEAQLAVENGNYQKKVKTNLSAYT